MWTRKRGEVEGKEKIGRKGHSCKISQQSRTRRRSQPMTRP